MLTESVADIPFRTFTNCNQLCLTQEQVMSDRQIADFIEEHPDCFMLDYIAAVYWYFPEGDSPEPYGKINRQ